MEDSHALNLLRYWRSQLRDTTHELVNLQFSFETEIDLQKGLVDSTKTMIFFGGVETILIKPDNSNDPKELNDLKDPNALKVLKDSKELSDSKELYDLKDLFDLDDPIDPKYLIPKDVLISPFYIKILDKGKVPLSFYPFWFNALLYSDGHLEVDKNKMIPQTPRAYLSPQAGEDLKFTFGNLDDVTAASTFDFDAEENWEIYWNYIQDVFEKITGSSITDYSPQGVTLVRVNTVVEYKATANTSGTAIITLYDYLLAKKLVPGSLKALCAREYSPLKSLLQTADFPSESLVHHGQMSFEFALSVSQRESLYQFNTMKEGEILAINGPPGTGKTTLLQSVVASEVVKSALIGKMPAVILACSTNNQAVTNILESFSKVTARQGVLYKRWLPGISGFGLYLPKSSFAKPGETFDLEKPDLDHHPYIGSSSSTWTGKHLAMENKNYVLNASTKYIEHYKAYSQISLDTVQAVVETLHKELKEKQNVLERGTTLWYDLKSIQALLDGLAIDSALEIFSNPEIEETELTSLELQLRDTDSKINNYLDRESILERIFSFLPSFKSEKARKMNLIIRGLPFTDRPNTSAGQNELFVYIAAKLKTIKQIRTVQNAWHKWKKENNIKANPPTSREELITAEKNQLPFFYDELEKGIRYDLFHLAIHYWEGRWLMETTRLLKERNFQRDKSEVASMRRWYRFSMLTPCFVSTFFMAPKFFRYADMEPKDNVVDKTPPLLNFIDLLIVDESGQVTPEIGASTFSLAKRALVVGDAVQIEPIYGVGPKIDYANLAKNGIVEDMNNAMEIKDLKEKGFLCSSGSIIKLAQKASSFHSNELSERGMLLVEHRRCWDEIIQYCNLLAYHGLLVPMKGAAKKTLFDPMMFIETGGKSVPYNGSGKANQEEANAVASWVLENHKKILAFYQDKENVSAAKKNEQPKTFLLKNLLGIITPYKGQQSLLGKALEVKGLKGLDITIGTVHAFQGAERDIVLFSSTYGANDLGKTSFIDSGVNMLNVAVSRAKDSFIMFGTPGNYVSKQGDNSYDLPPSKLLYRYMKDLVKKDFS